MADFPHAHSLLQDAVTAGSRGGTNPEVDILTMKRAKMSWYSARIREEMGVPTKPTGSSKCPLCRKMKTNFQLDHMSPWRLYVVAFTGTAGGVKIVGKRILVPKKIVRALYNDPANLWWICSDCNSEKTDKVYDQLSQLEELESGSVPSGELGRNIDAFEVIEL